MKVKVNVVNTPGCAWVKSFYQTALNYNRVRWYPIFDGNHGDAHPPWWYHLGGTTNATNSDIHICAGTFGNTFHLVRNLIHEAAHVHFNLWTDENHHEAYTWASTCNTLTS
jgi:hypothetical protein